MLHYETIHPGTLDLLKRILSIPELSELRLVGGTALALQLGHRISIDLDMFGKIELNTSTIADMLGQIGPTTILQDSENIHVYDVAGVKVDIVNFPYGWKKPAIEEDGIRIADIDDIAAMKVAAAIGRGTKKDFYDIAQLLEHYELQEILGLFLEKYPHSSEFTAIKGLTYFDDAETDANPNMLVKQTWNNVKKAIIKAVNKL